MRPSGHGQISIITLPASGSVSYGYDSKGNRTSIAHNHGSATHTTTLTYNDPGRVASIRDPRQITTQLNHEANGVDLKEIQNGMGSILMSYNDAHDVTSVTSRPGHNATLVYNSDGQVTSVVDARNIPSAYL